MHLQADVGGPRLGVRWGVAGIGGVVLQGATLLQVGLELLTAPPAGQGEKQENDEEEELMVGHMDGCVAEVWSSILHQGAELSHWSPGVDGG